MSPKIVIQLRDIGVNDDHFLKLEFFFYTDIAKKGKSLAVELDTLGYSVKSHVSAHDKTAQLVTGWTTPMLMSDDNLLDWVTTMCILGYKYDCEFDGWGTNPNQ